MAAFLIGWLGLIQSKLDRLDWICLSWQKKERLNQLQSVYLDVAADCSSDDCRPKDRHG